MKGKCLMLTGVVLLSFCTMRGITLSYTPTNRFIMTGTTHSINGEEYHEMKDIQTFNTYLVDEAGKINHRATLFKTLKK